MKRFNIGIDIDGVLSDFVGGARILFKSMLNGWPSDDLIQTSWAFSSLGITEEETKLMWKKLNSIYNWWIGLSPYVHTEFLPHLCDNHRCVFITDRMDGTGYPIEKQTQLWLHQQYNIDYPTVLISRNKGDIARGLGLDFYIDDKPENVLDVIEKAPRCKTFLQRRTYNEACAYPAVESLNQFDRIIERHARS